MTHNLSLSEIVDRLPLDNGMGDVTACAEADYLASAHQLTVRLSAHVCPEDGTATDRHLRPEWLPKDEVVTEGVEAAETHELTREVFHSWVKKVRTAAEARR
jgi:hypothetical protein